jgi:hypothetical protein
MAPITTHRIIERFRHTKDSYCIETRLVLESAIWSLCIKPGWETALGFLHGAFASAPCCQLVIALIGGRVSCSFPVLSLFWRGYFGCILLILHGFLHVIQIRPAPFTGIYRDGRGSAPLR